MTPKHYQFFTNTACEYYPCHDLEPINCLFCFCPLYTLDCGGNFTVTPKGIKNCSACTLPHGENGYEYIISKLKESGDRKK